MVSTFLGHDANMFIEEVNNDYKAGQALVV